MRNFTTALLAFFWHWGGLGLLALGIVDSSFLFAPFGNDLLVVALTAHYHSVARMLYYAATSTAGSLIGCFTVDLACRDLGEKGLERHLSKKRIADLKKKVDQNAAWALVVASIAPPPFPFTPFIMAASALQYPRKHMYTLVGAARMFRFSALGVLALFYGPTILKWANSPVVNDAIIGLTIVCVIGSIVSVVGWIKRSRKPLERNGDDMDNKPEPKQQPEPHPANQ